VDIKEFKRIYKYTCDKCGKFSHIKRDYCRTCGSPALRRVTKDEYKKVAKQTNSNQKEYLRVKAKMMEMLDKQLILLQDLAKNDEEYKTLLKRKKSGESVEDLISKNRSRKEILEKENKEKGEIAVKWGRSEEGRKVFAYMDMWARINPKPAIKFHLTRKLVFRMATLEKQIKKKEEEYENLLQKKGKGEYVDDLMDQNRHAVEILKQDMENTEKTLDKLETEKKTDWKSRIER